MAKQKVLADFEISALLQSCLLLSSKLLASDLILERFVQLKSEF